MNKGAGLIISDGHLNFLRSCDETGFKCEYIFKLYGITFSLHHVFYIGFIFKKNSGHLLQSKRARAGIVEFDPVQNFEQVTLVKNIFR